MKTVNDKTLNDRMRTTGRTSPGASSPSGPTTLKRLVGAGDRIGLVTLPVLAVAVVLQLASPSLFTVGGPPAALRWLSIVILVPGLAVWAWSVVLILTRVPRGELITSGPYRLVKHPLYTGVALLVLPWAGFLLDTWLGAVVGAVLYLASRTFAPGEEAELAASFGPAWDDYRRRVLIPWL
jgi:protein-S-isoprenylcysteine O-methyltransferase Ste14